MNSGDDSKKNTQLDAELKHPDGTIHNISVKIDDNVAAHLERIMHHSLTLTALMSVNYDVPAGSSVTSIKLTPKPPADTPEES